jgi:hypothetical protein
MSVVFTTRDVFSQFREAMCSAIKDGRTLQYRNCSTLNATWIPNLLSESTRLGRQNMNDTRTKQEIYKTFLLEILKERDNCGHLGEREELTRLRRCEIDTTATGYSGAADELPGFKTKKCLKRLRDYRQLRTEHTVQIQQLVIFQYNGTLYKYFIIMNRNRVMT